MRMDGAWKRGGIALAALIAGLAAAHAGSLKIESWRNDDADIWNSTLIPAFQKHYPDIKVEFSATQPDGLQCGAQRQARWRHRRRPHHLPPVRRLAAALQQASTRRPQRPQGARQLPRRRQGRLVDRRRQDDLLRADGLGHPRLHVQRGRFQEDRREAAEDDGRVPRHPRQAQEGRNLHADRHGHRGPVGGRDHGLPEHRSRLLEGRDGTGWC